MKSEIINYSQCWEDPLLLNEALEINAQDTVLSITSGGDNTLFLLLKQPKKIVSIDFNPVQNYLLELKIATLKALPHGEVLEFLGESGARFLLFAHSNVTLMLTGIVPPGPVPSIACGTLPSTRSPNSFSAGTSPFPAFFTSLSASRFIIV